MNKQSVVDQAAVREAQIKNAVEVTLSQLRMLLAMLKHLEVIVPQGSMARTDTRAIFAHTLNVHEWMFAQWNEANGPTPGASITTLAERLAACEANLEPAASQDSNDSLIQESRTGRSSIL